MSKNGAWLTNFGGTNPAGHTHGPENTPDGCHCEVRR